MSKAMKGARLQAGKEYIERGAETRNGYFNHQNRRLGYKTSVSNDTSSTESLTRDTFASREFSFLNSGDILSPSETELGDIVGLSRRTV